MQCFVFGKVCVYVCVRGVGRVVKTMGLFREVDSSTWTIMLSPRKYNQIIIIIKKNMLHGTGSR